MYPASQTLGKRLVAPPQPQGISRNLISPIQQNYQYTKHKYHSRSRLRTPVQRIYDKDITAIIIVLFVASLASLYTAYHIFVKTPRVSQTSVIHDLSHARTAPDDNAGVLDEPSREKYLAYLPHSGFHNQRIALENALVLARLLNRTLLLPPVRLGVPLSYAPFDELYEMSANSTKAGLDYCSRITLDDSDISIECVEYMEYTHISWDWLVDLSEIKKDQPLLEGWNFTDAWLHDVLRIPTDDKHVLRLKETSRNQYAFRDFFAFNSPERKFSESIHIATLAYRPESLIQLGSLFGSARLHFRTESNFRLRKKIRQRMAFSNPRLVSTAEAIRSTLGGSYLAVHLRIGDSYFELNAPETVRLAWWKLLHLALGFTDDQVLEIEREFLPNEDILQPPLIAPDLPALRSPYPPLPAFPTNASPSSGRSCRGAMHDSLRLQPLNAPLFIATDAQSPSLNPLLWRFLRTFPCSFFLEDFPDDVRSLEKLRSESDGVPLAPFLMPFLDAMVAGQAWYVVGTEQSTFSAFVADVLWRTYHGFEIVQRG